MPSDELLETPAIAALLDAIGVTFRSEQLLARALTHPSQPLEQEIDRIESNERLEFLGDAVVELAVSEHLYRSRSDADEGTLTTARSHVVRGTVLAEVAKRIGLGEALRLGPNASALGTRRQRSVLAAGFEALLGAVYLDQGWEVARDCALRLLAAPIAAALAEQPRNPKGELQELTQRERKETPSYRLAGTDGPAHARQFTVEVVLGGEVLASGTGHSKQEAEELAAARALAAWPAATSP